MTDEQDWSYPHEWALEEDGSVDTSQLEYDHHNGPKCLRCEQYFCMHCEPDIWTEPCPEQDVELVAPPFTKVQMDARLRYLNKLGYIVRSGIIVGWQEPNPVCREEDHKWRVASKLVIGEGIHKKVIGTKQCVVCRMTKVFP